jgi:tetratricopeptide (TPR) repeat protein
VLGLQFKEEAADARLRDCLAGWQQSDLSFPGAVGISFQRAQAALSRGDQAAAERHYRRALEARQKGAASLEYPSLTWLQFCVGATLFNQGETEKARAALQGLVPAARMAVQQADLDPDDLIPFAVALSIAGSGQAEDLKAALALARRAVEESERRNPQPRILALHVLAGIHQRNGELDRAIEANRQALTLVRPTALPRVAGGLYWRTELEARLVQCLIEKGDRPAAEEVMREGLKLFQSHLPKGDPALAAAQVNLAAFLTDEKRYADAEPLLLAAEENLKAHPQRPASASLTRRLTEARERLVQLYDAWEKPDEATKWRQELKALREADNKP